MEDFRPDSTQTIKKVVLLRAITVLIFRSNQIFGFFRAWFWLQITLRVRAGFCIAHVGLFTTLQEAILPFVSWGGATINLTLVTLKQCRRYGGTRGPCPPQTTACVPPFWFNRKTVFGTSRNGRTTDNDGKTNHYVQTYFSFGVFSILCEIAGYQLL